MIEFDKGATSGPTDVHTDAFWTNIPQYSDLWCRSPTLVLYF